MVKRLMPIFSALLLLAASQIHALSLGDITLESSAGEPLQASIELLDSEGLSVSDISAMVASAADFQRFDVERIAALDNLTISVAFVDGAPILRLSSPISIDEPFLSLVLDTRWPAGRVLTEYTLRLESPAFSAQSNQQVTAAPTQSVFEPVVDDADTATDSDADSPETEADNAAPATATVAAAEDSTDTNTAGSATNVAPATDQGQSQPAQTAPMASADDLANASTLTVNAGDTLWQLALRARPDDSVSVQQTMLALQRLNPDAFLGNNINRVKRGEVLRVPELSEIRRLAATEAIAEVTRQNLAFQQRGTTPVGSEPVTERPDAATSGAAQGQLRVVTADDDSDEPVDASASAASAQSSAQQIARNDEQLEALEDSMAQREEELDRLDLENTELNSRLAMLQQQISSAQEIIRLRDLELAQLQTQLAEAEPAAAADTDTDSEQTTTITMAPDAGPVERFINMMLNNTWALLAAVAVLVLLLVLVLIRRNRAASTDEQRAQRENDDMPLGEDNDDELLFSGVAAAAAAAEEEDGESDKDTAADDADDASGDGKDEADSDDSLEAVDSVTYGADGGLENEDSEESSADDVSPEGMAFDSNTTFDDEFALDDTLESDPDAEPDTDEPAENADEADDGPDWGDADLDLDDVDDADDDINLQESSADGSVDAGADTAAAEEVSAETEDVLDDDDDLSWPDATAVTPAAEDNDEQGWPDAAPVTPETPEPADTQVVTDDAEYEIYDEAADQTDTPAAEPEPEPEPEPELEPELEPEPTSTVIQEADDDAEVDEAGQVGEVGQVDEADQDEKDKPADKIEDDFDDLAFISNEDSFDDDEDDEEDFAFLSDSDEAATKLDLARAYIDMGDSAGAREILAEVVKEGTESQRRDAESLLERL